MKGVVAKTEIQYFNIFEETLDLGIFVVSPSDSEIIFVQKNIYMPI